MFDAARELLADEDVVATARAKKSAARAADVGRQTLGVDPIGATWPMPRRQTRLLGLAAGATALLLLAVAYGGWLWVAFVVVCAVGVGLAVRVLRSKIVLGADALRIQGTFRTRTIAAASVKSVALADITSTIAKSREGDIPSSQAVRLELLDGRRVTISAADVTPKVALAGAADPQLSDLRNVIAAWLAAVGHRGGGGT